MFNIQAKLQIDYNAKTITPVDNTDYSELDFANIAVTGEGTILSPTGVVIAVGSLINISGGNTQGAAYPLPLDNQGNILPGDYTMLYAPRFVVTNFPIDQFTTGPNTIWVAGENWENALWNDPITSVAVTVASATTPGNNGTKTQATPGSVWNSSETEIPTQQALTAEAGGSATISFNNKYSTVTTVNVAYTGANIINPCIEVQYDCRSTRYGQIIFTDATELPAGHVLVSRAWTIQYPSFLLNPVTPAPVTSNMPNVTINTLAYGPWAAQLTRTIQVTQPDGLVYTYTTTSTWGKKVSCAGSICDLLCGMKAFADKYAPAVAQGNPPQTYTTTSALISLYYGLVVTAQQCGDNTAYDTYYAALKELLGACGAGCSGCSNCSDCSDCGSGCGESGGGCDDCQDNAVGWVDNGTDAYSNDLSESIFATATPLSVGSNLSPNSTVDPQVIFGTVNVSSSYFQFANELAALGLSVGKRFVDVRYKAFSSTNGAASELEIGGQSVLNLSLSLDYYADVFFRIGTKRSGNNTIFTVQGFVTTITDTGAVNPLSYYNEFTNLITAVQNLTIEHIFSGAALVYLADITPFKVK